MTASSDLPDLLLLEKVYLTYISIPQFIIGEILSIEGEMVKRKLCAEVTRWITLVSGKWGENLHVTGSKQYGGMWGALWDSRTPLTLCSGTHSGCWMIAWLSFTSLLYISFQSFYSHTFSSYNYINQQAYGNTDHSRESEQSEM